MPVVNLIASPILLGEKANNLLYSEIPSLTAGAKSSREVADELLKQGRKLAAQKNTVEDELAKVQYCNQC